MNGVYIHIPFCRSKCPYCDFYSLTKSVDLQGVYVNSLIDEIMGKYSNVFLVIENKIIGSLKNIPVSLDGKRISLYGANYTLPEKQDKLSPYVLSNIESALKDYYSLFFIRKGDKIK